MEYTYYTDLNSMLQALVTGVLLGVYYDAFRLLRRMISFTDISVAFQDIVFWLTSAVYIFFVCVRLNNGYIRIYFVFFALVGWGLYYFTCGKLVFKVLDIILGFFHRLSKTAKNKILSMMEKCIIYRRR